MAEMTPKKVIVISLVSALVILGVGFLFSKVNGGTYIPATFFQARVAGAGAAKNIALLVGNSLANLSKIEAADKAGNSFKALELVQYEQNNSQDKQNAALALSAHLEEMARATNDITPPEARQLSVQAVTTGVSMVSRLIDYNGLLSQLFVGLNARFSGQGQPGGSPSVSDLVSRLNGDATMINDLNQQFNSLLDQFDQKFVK